ncbi:MAG: hypothetical protein CMD49_02585 [Gammaproteobacteria bacterium]|nr:hypothetical protein [Gammaproteobacteria bacterium]|tara:strand:+ start:216 stop:494 length:279 start_codon:yes stop_codon:yes gene_type:complete
MIAVNNFLEQFLSAYLVTSQVMFPILIVIIILLVKDFNKYGDISKKVNSRLDDLAELVEKTGFKKDSKDNNLDYVEKYLSKRNIKAKVKQKD